MAARWTWKVNQAFDISVGTGSSESPFRSHQTKSKHVIRGLIRGLLKSAVFADGRSCLRPFCALSPRYLLGYHFLPEVFSHHLLQPEASPSKCSHHCLPLSSRQSVITLFIWSSSSTQLEGKFPREHDQGFRCLELWTWGASPDTLGLKNMPTIWVCVFVCVCARVWCVQVSLW